MSSLATLLEQQPIVFVHLVAALGAVLLGAVLMLRRKGSTSHRVLGWTWVALMGTTALTSVFIHGGNLPSLAGFTPIHALTALVAVMLPRGILYIRRGNVTGHRKTMRGLFFGACVAAGLFTLLPGRFLGQLLWHQTLGLV